MKTRYYILFLGLTLSLGSCEIDNYDEPETLFEGQLTYEGQPIGVAADEVRFQLWQSGFGNEGPIDVHVAQDGSFSALLFDGEYKLDFLDGEGPFVVNPANGQQGDTIFLNLEGDTTMELEVVPYYMIRDAQFNAAGGTVAATAEIEQIITGENARNLERVALYLNGTRFVSGVADENIASTDADLTDLGDIDVSVDVPDGYDRDYIFARIGVKIEGVEDMLYSRVEKLDLTN